MARDIRDQVADSLLALLPMYHRHIFRVTATSSGLRIAQYRALGMLMKCGPLKMSELGRLLYVSKPSMTLLADTLTENGWATRHSGEGDRRIVRLSITSAGKKHLQQAFEIYRADVRTMLAGLDESDLTRMSTALEDLHRIFDNLEGVRHD